MSVSTDLQTISEKGYQQLFRYYETEDEEGNLAFCLMSAIYHLHTGKRLAQNRFLSEINRAFRDETGYDPDKAVIYKGKQYALDNLLIYLNDYERLSFEEAALVLKELGL